MVEEMKNDGADDPISLLLVQALMRHAHIHQAGTLEEPGLSTYRFIFIFLYFKDK